MSKSKMISWNDFENVDMRVGKIVQVNEFPEARKPAYKLRIDFGLLGIKKSSAQVTSYAPDALMGRQVIGVVNFPPKQIGTYSSEVLVLGAVQNDGKVVLLSPDPGSMLGMRVA